jgi:hypothetical protein
LVETLVKASASTGWMHESVDVANPRKFTRRYVVSGMLCLCVILTIDSPIGGRWAVLCRISWNRIEVRVCPVKASRDPIRGLPHKCPTKHALSHTTTTLLTIFSSNYTRVTSKKRHTVGFVGPIHCLPNWSYP